MEESQKKLKSIERKLFLGFIQIHILHHANEKPIYGVWMMEELESHGYKISPGTLYPLLSKMDKDGLLEKEEKNVNGRIIKYYNSTELGRQALISAKNQARKLFHEVGDTHD